MHKLKSVRFSTVDLGDGGAEKILINILKSLSREKYKLSIFMFEKKGVYLSDVPHDVQINYFISPDRWPKFLLPLYNKIFVRIAFRVFMHFPALVYKISKISSVDIDIAFLQDTSYLLNNNPSKIKVSWIHTNVSHAAVRKQDLKSNLAYADKIVCVSHGVSNGLIHEYPEYSSKVVTVLNPSPIKEIQSEAKLMTVKFSKPTIIAVGKIKYAKGFDLLVQSFKILIEKGYDWQLKILGDGNETDKVKLINLITELGLLGKVELLGFKKSPYPYIHAADLFVLSSRFEGFGQVVVEALSVGTPIVATNCDFGPYEILQGGRCGILVAVNDIQALADGLERGMIDKETVKDMVNNGLIRAQDFNLQCVNKQIEGLLDNL